MARLNNNVFKETDLSSKYTYKQYNAVYEQHSMYIMLAEILMHMKG